MYARDQRTPITRPDKSEAFENNSLDRIGQGVEIGLLERQRSASGFALHGSHGRLGIAVFEGTELVSSTMEAATNTPWPGYASSPL